MAQRAELMWRVLGGEKGNGADCEIPVELAG